MITIFCDFCQFSAKKLAFFSKSNVMIKNLHNLALFWVKNANIFANVFGENILKIITSVPDWANFRLLCDCLLWAVLLKDASPHFGLHFSTVKVMYILPTYMFQKRVGLHFCDFFSKAHLITLGLEHYATPPGRGYFLFLKLPTTTPTCMYPGRIRSHDQGDQIGRVFAYWVTVHSG
jgi:hypothetical protein